jgi:hypothetical protein
MPLIGLLESVRSFNRNALARLFFQGSTFFFVFFGARVAFGAVQLLQDAAKMQPRRCSRGDAAVCGSDHFSLKLIKYERHRGSNLDALPH